MEVEFEQDGWDLVVMAMESEGSGGGVWASNWRRKNMNILFLFLSWYYLLCY